jgi:hypothetical protein
VKFHLVVRWRKILKPPDTDISDLDPADSVTLNGTPDSICGRWGSSRRRPWRTFTRYILGVVPKYRHPHNLCSRKHGDSSVANLHTRGADLSELTLLLPHNHYWRWQQELGAGAIRTGVHSFHVRLLVFAFWVMSVPKSFHEAFDSNSTHWLCLLQFFGYCGSKSAVEVIQRHL